MDKKRIKNTRHEAIHRARILKAKLKDYYATGKSAEFIHASYKYANVVNVLRNH